MASISEKITLHTNELVYVLGLLKERLTDDNIKSEKEMKYLRFIISSYYKIKDKVEKVLGKAPKYYVEDDDDSESDCDIGEEPSKFIERFQNLITEGTHELCNIEHFNGLIQIEKIDLL